MPKCPKCGIHLSCDPAVQEHLVKAHRVNAYGTKRKSPKSK